MNRRSRSLVCDFHLNACNRFPLRISNAAHNTARPHCLCQQQRRNEQRRESEYRNSRNETARGIQVQASKPSIQTIHRTSLKVPFQKQVKQTSWIGNRRSMGQETRISTQCEQPTQKPALANPSRFLGWKINPQPCRSKSEQYQTIHHACQSSQRVTQLSPRPQRSFSANSAFKGLVLLATGSWQLLL